MFESKPLDQRGRRWLLATLVVAVSLSGQLFFASIVPPKASLAGANGLSASIGLAHQRGMTIARSEGLAIKAIDPGVDVATVYAPDEERLPLIEPLPGLVLIYFMVGLTGLPLSLNALAVLNMILVAFGAALLADELTHRRFSLGALTGIGIASFIPLYRLSVAVSYDVFEFFFALMAVVCLLRFERTGNKQWVVVDGIVLGLGLWIRSYFILYVLAQGVIALLLLKRAGVSPRLTLGWLTPVVVLAGTMVLVRDSGSTGTPLTRGGFWHSFWMGVGQFKNDQVDGFTDWDACDLAHEHGYEPPCDRVYSDDRLPYLFQYALDYNAVLGAHAKAWIPDHIPRLALNTVIRVGWLAIPGLMDSSKLDDRSSLRALAVLASIVILILAVLGFLAFRKVSPGDGIILLGTYLALLPLTPYYIIAKVVTVSYFCVIALAAAGLVWLWDLCCQQTGVGD